MPKKISANEAQLRNMIREIVKEELALISAEEQNGWETELEMRRVLPRQQEKSEQQEGPWAIFGEPKPDPYKRSPFKQERPRALPGWSEPYRPDFSNFDVPPFMPHKPKSS